MNECEHKRLITFFRVFADLKNALFPKISQ